MGRKTFRDEKEKVTGSWSKLYRQNNDEYISVYISSLIESRRREKHGVY
jgi:hypothetical protein